MDEDKSTRLVRCVRHGLSYDPSVAGGCVLCRPTSSHATGRPLDRFLSGLLVAVVLLLAGVIAVHFGSPYFERALGNAALRQDTSKSASAVGAASGSSVSSAPSAPSAPSSVFVLHARNVIGRGGSVYVPAQAAATARPLLVLFHGTGGSGADIINAFRPLAEARGIILLAPDSGRSPDGAYNWQVPDSPNEGTPDQAHVAACLAEVFAAPGLHIDPEHVLALGHSGGGSSAAYIATTDPRLRGFAVLHGGVFAGGLGSNRVPAWFSTGTEDPLRPPVMVERAAAAAAAHATTVTTRLYPGGHAMSDTEIREVLAWWLGT